MSLTDQTFANTTESTTATESITNVTVTSGPSDAHASEASEADTTNITAVLATETKVTPRVALLSYNKLQGSEDAITPSDLISTPSLSATMGSRQEPAIQIEPFSMFLKKLLIYLCVKTSSDLAQLVDPFINYVQDLLQSETIDVLGDEIKTYIGDWISKINASTTDMLRNHLGEYQLMLMNRNKNSDDLLALMDHMYEVAEEEAMQRVIIAVSRFPNVNVPARSIVRGFVNNVFLKPMIRTAGTEEGSQLFTWIKEIVNSKNSYNIKPILRQRINYVETTKAITKYVDHDFKNEENIYDRYQNKIRNNIQLIESMLGEGEMNDEEDDAQKFNEEYESYDISNKNKPIMTSEKKSEENENKYSNDKQAEEERYESIDESQNKREPPDNYKANNDEFPLSYELKSQVKPGYRKENSDESFVKKRAIIEDAKGIPRNYEQINKDVLKPTPKDKKLLEHEVLYNWWSFIHQNKKESGPYIPKIGDRHRNNTMTNQFTSAMKQDIEDLDDKTQPKIPFKATKEIIKNNKSNTPPSNKSGGMSNKVNVLRKHTDVWKKNKKIPKETENIEYTDAKESQSSTEEIMVWSGVHSSQESDVSSSNSYEGSEESSGLKYLLTTKKRARKVLKKSDSNEVDYTDDDLRMRNDDGQKLADKYRLTTRHRKEERGVKYRLKTKPLHFYRRNYRKDLTDRHRNKVTNNIAAVVEATEHNDTEMELKANLRVFVKNLDFVKYNATRTPILESTSIIHLRDNSHNIDEEAILKKNMYKAMKKMLKK